MIRELVQNADDGGALKICLVRTEPIAGVDHPLLNAPGLLVINDGRFQESDNAAIRRLGLGHKIVETGTIGKFGLGLKSVFHLCEVFFFGASSVRKHDGKEAGGAFVTILNPWSRLESPSLGATFKAWNRVTSKDKNKLLELVRSSVKWEQWFFVYLPFRRSELCPRDSTGEPVAITANFAGDREILQEDLARWWPSLAQEMSPVLPLLHNLTELEQKPRPGETLARLVLAPKGSRSAYPEGLTRGKERALGGQFDLTFGTDKAIPVPFGGQEAHLADPRLQELKNNSHWPRQPVLFVEGEDRLQSADKNAPHAAAYFSRLAGEKGLLRIRLATFLPVGDPLEAIPLEGDLSVDLMLHGFFFLDPSRSKVRFPDAPTAPGSIINEEQLMGSWNHYVLHLGTLPLVPRALCEFCERARLTHPQASLLTGAFSNSDFCRSYLDSLTSRFTWECRLNGGPEGARFDDELAVTAVAGRKPQVSRWVLLSAEEDPRPPYQFPPGAEDELLDTFSEWRRLAELGPVLRPSQPRLSAICPRSSLSLFELSALLGEQPEGFFEAIEHERGNRPAPRVRRFHLLADLLQASWEHDEAARGWIARWAGSFLSLLLTSFSYERIKDLSAPLTRLVRMAPREACFVPTLDGGEAAYVLIQQLNHATKGRLLTVPSYLLTEELGSNPKLASDLTDSMLGVLSGGSNAEVLDRLAHQIVLSAAEPRAEVWARNPHLKLFRAYDAALEAPRECRVRFADLQRAHESHRLFLLKAFNPDLEALLARALAPGPAGPVLVLRHSAAELAYGMPERVPDCGLDSIVRLLSMKPTPALGDPGARGSLLARLLTQAPSAHQRFALRYLLHGAREHFDEAGPLWLLRPQDTEASWPGVLATILQSSDERWRVIHPDATRALSAAAQDWLDLAAPEERQVCADLQTREDLGCLSQSQRLFIQRSVQDDQVFKSLWIHETHDQGLTSIQEQVFLESNYPLPAELQASATFVVPSADPEVRKRQARLIPLLGPPDAVRLALAADHPERFWSTILTALDRTGCDVSAELRSQLRHTPWIPMLVGPASGFGQLLYLPGLDKILDGFLERFGQGFSSLAQVIPELTSHPAWIPACRALLPGEEEALDLLAQLLEEPAVPSLGQLPASLLTDEGFLDILSSMPEELLPGALLLNEPWVRRQPRFESLLRSLARPAGLGRLLELYRWAADQHASARRAPRKRLALEALALEYLVQAIRSKEFAAEFERLPLLSLSGAWKKAGQLCHGVPNVDPASLLSEPFAEVLKAFLPEAGQLETGPKEILVSTRHHSLSDCLQTLFGSPGWKKCPEEVIGAFYAIFAPQEEAVAKEAVRRLRLPDLKGTRAGLFIPEEATCRHTPPGRSQHNLTLRLELEVLQADTVRVVALSGDRLSVRLDKSISRLLMASSKPAIFERTAVFTLQLLLFDPIELEASEIQGIVWCTAWEIIARTYFNERTEDAIKAAKKAASDYWSEQILEAGQFDINVAQKLIEEYFPLYFRMLPRTKKNKLAQEMENLDSLRHKRAEADVSKVYDVKRRLRDEVEADLPKIQQRIVSLIRTDAEVQASLLEMVRCKIGGHFQYTLLSIPFELFQNADDAEVELAGMGGEAAITHDFLIEELPEGLVFGHNGRLINQYLSPDGRDYRSIGYHKDLEKMLILQGSDKELDREVFERTGKFGLGFKSVFLASDEVEVRSGRRHFRIVGGVYPVPAEADSFFRNRPQENASFNTQIYLRPRKGSSTKEWLDSILTDFRRRLAIQLVFAHSIRSAVWKDRSGVVRQHGWQPRPVLGLDSVLIGRLSQFASEAGNERALVLESSAGRVLFLLTSAGIAPPDPDMPRGWVTTPLAEVAPCNFVVNANFAVDIGRHQLAAESKENRSLAQALGRAAGASLVELYLKATNAGWPALRQELELSPDLAEETFWAGLWKSLGGATSRAGEEDTLSEFERLIRGVEAECLRSLTGRNPVIPTDLWGSFSGTTAQHSIRAQVTGLLARETIFRGAERLLARYYAPLSLVDFRVAQLLARVLPGFSVPTLNLSRLVTQALPDDQLTPETADLVAEACSEQSLNEFEGELHGEIQELRQKLGSLLAKNADAQWRRLDGLLIDSAQDTEEQLLCRFSPSERLLSPDYSEQARPFLLQVRGAPSSSTEEIADWVLSASGGSARHGALIYILQGARGRDVAARLYRLLATGRPSWLRAVLETGVLVALGFSAGDARELIRLILPPTAGPRPLETKPIGNPIARLRRLQEWWTRNGEECLRRYERRVYPHQCLPDLESKKGWLVLLMLGALHRMGRQKRQQSRGFLEMFESRNWLDKMLFARAKPEGLIDVLDQYFAEEDDQRFFHWLGFLPTMYQLSRWLDEYVVMLEEFNKVKGSQTVEDFIAPRSAAYWQGANVSAPNLRRTLGVGTCFVLRELRRRKWLRKDELDPYCFTPTKRVLERLELLTGDVVERDSHLESSRRVYTILHGYLGDEGATFGHCFDLPFRLVPDDQFEDIARA